MTAYFKRCMLSSEETVLVLRVGAPLTGSEWLLVVYVADGPLYVLDEDLPGLLVLGVLFLAFHQVVENLWTVEEGLLVCSLQFFDHASLASAWDSLTEDVHIWHIEVPHGSAYLLLEDVVLRQVPGQDEHIGRDVLPHEVDSAVECRMEQDETVCETACTYLHVLESLDVIDYVLVHVFQGVAESVVEVFSAEDDYDVLPAQLDELLHGLVVQLFLVLVAGWEDCWLEFLADGLVGAFQMDGCRATPESFKDSVVLLNVGAGQEVCLRAVVAEAEDTGALVRVRVDAQL